MYLRSKGRGEAALQAAAAQGLQLSVLRPSVIFGAQDSFLNLFAKLQVASLAHLIRHYAALVDAGDAGTA